MKTSAILLIALLAWSFISGGVDAHFAARGPAEPSSWFFGSLAVSVALIFAWYVADSNERRFRRPRWMNVLIVGAAVLAVPIYLWSSRARGQRLKACLAYLGFLLLVTGADAVGGLLAG